MKIAIGCDHGGFHLKEAIKAHLLEKNIEVEDFGTNGVESVNYPVYASMVAESVTSKSSHFGILCCGTGIGMSIAANKVKGVRAACVSDTFSAKATREHNDSNVLCLGERVLGPGLALDIVDTWLDTSFQGGRHQTRIDQVAEFENK